MKKAYVVCVASLLIGLFAGGAFAQSYSAKSPVELQKFLSSRPALANDLQKNPSLYGNEQFLSKHPDLNGFLNKHPKYWASLRHQHAAASTGNAAAEMQGFLAQHPTMAAKIHAHPELVGNAKYVNSNFQLRQFLFTHPEVVAAQKQHPREFSQALRSEPLPAAIAPVATAHNPKAKSQVHKAHPKNAKAMEAKATAKQYKEMEKERAKAWAAAKKKQKKE